MAIHPAFTIYGTALPATLCNAGIPKASMFKPSYRI
jgi:hypothetical protein